MSSYAALQREEWWRRGYRRKEIKGWMAKVKEKGG
jgi:hypothetical protein